MKDQPAFPTVAPSPQAEVLHGMTLRQYLAGQALVGMLAGSRGLEITTKDFAEQSVKLADALIEELEKNAVP
jgi:hypothetical protein